MILHVCNPACVLSGKIGANSKLGRGRIALRFRMACCLPYRIVIEGQCCFLFLFFAVSICKVTRRNLRFTALQSYPNPLLFSQSTVKKAGVSFSQTPAPLVFMAWQKYFCLNYGHFAFLYCAPTHVVTSRRQHLAILRPPLTWWFERKL